MVYARVRETPDGLGLSAEGIGNQLCSKCKAGLDDAMHKEIDRLDVKLRAHLKTLGCPCCEADLPGVAPPKSTEFHAHENRWAACA